MSEDVPGIHVANVSRFFHERVPGASPPLDFELIGGGRSNLTYRVRSGARAWALRRPPLGHVLPTAHDMAREYRVLRALEGSDVPAPTAVALCEDPAVNERPFYVMEYCEGLVLEGDLPPGYAETPAERRCIGEALVDTLVRLHAVDYEAVGLADFGRPRGYLERQVRRWARQWEGNRTAELPQIEELLRRLAAALPADSDARLVHGDYRLGNMALDPRVPGRIAALFDWEMATLGDPLADLGYTLVYWVEAGDPPTAGAVGRLSSVTAREGFPSRAELVERYAARSGRDVEAIDFYQVLALTKLAVIAEGIYKRHRMGKTLGAGFQGMAREAEPLAARALEIAARSPDARLRG